MNVEAFFERMPFANRVGVDVTEAEDGHAEGHVELTDELSWNTEEVVAHGGVTFTLADVVGGAAFASLVDQPAPAIDMRIDYLERGTGDLHAAADVSRLGDHVGTVDIEVYIDDDTRVAEARGVYKTG